MPEFPTHFVTTKSALILFCLVLFVAVPVHAEMIYDFTNVLPEDASVNNLEIVDGKLQLSDDASGSFVTAGDITIRVNAFDVSGKLIKLSATRVNMAVNGDFSDTALNTIYTFNPNSTCASCAAITKAKTPGFWFTNGTYMGAVPTVINTASSGDADYAAKLTQANQSLMQFFQIIPGEDYTLNFDLDATELAESATTEQLLSVYFGFLDSSLQNLNIYDPKNHVPMCTAFPCSYPFLTAASYDQDESGEIRFRIRALDCDDHTQYVDGSGLYSGDVSYNFCQNGGTALEILDDDGAVVGSYSSADEIAYMALYFKASWMGSSYSANYALVDDVVLDLEDQIKVEVLDAAGVVVQSSTLDNGFYVAPTTTAAAIRLSLKSHRTDVSPSVTALTISDGLDVIVTVGDVIATFTETRLNPGVNTPPRSEFVDSTRTESRSQCVDPIDSEIKSCHEVYLNHGIDEVRAYFDTNYIEVSWDGIAEEYSFRIDPTDEYLFNYRMREYLDAGIGIASVMLPGPDSYFAMSTELFNDYCGPITDPASALYDSANDCCFNSAGAARSWWSGIFCSADHFADRRSSPTRTGNEQAVHMITSAATYIANLYNGETTYTFTDGATLTFPKVDVFEVYGETNRGTYDDDPVPLAWADLPQDDFVDLVNAIGTAFRAAQPDAAVMTPSVLTDGVSDGGDGNAIDVPYALEYLSRWDKDIFTAYNIHPYVDFPHQPEEIWTQWAEVKAGMTAAGWTNHPLYVTEWGFTQEVNDPYCNDTANNRYINSGSAVADFSRGWGENEFAKLIAREQLLILSLPVAKSNLYGDFTNESEYLGYDVTRGSSTYYCWHHHSSANYNIFSRQEGSGILSGDWTDSDTSNDNDEPTIFEVNAAGQAYLTIAKHLSVSNPYESSVALADEASAENEKYFSTFFAADESDTYYLGLWWYKDYFYTPNILAINDTYGIMDEGFTETRIHDVAISGISSVSSAAIISLEDGSETSLTVTTNGGGQSVVNGVIFGEMPVLLKISTAATTELSGSVASSQTSSTSGTTSSASATESITAEPEAQKSGMFWMLSGGGCSLSTTSR